MKKLILLIFFSLIFIPIVTLPLYLKVKTECITQYGPCPPEINSQISSNGQTLAKTKNKIKKVFKNNQLISNFRTQFKLPNILVVNLVIKKPSFAIVGSNTNEVALVDGDGRVLTIAKTTNLPTISNPTYANKIGENVKSTDLFALKLMEGVYEMYQVNYGVIEGDSLVVELPSQIKVLFPLSGDRDLILGSLRLVYSKVTSEDAKGKYTQIDLRFKNPVLR